MDRLSVLDAEFLHMEDGVGHMHIAGVCVFEGPAPPAADISAMIAGKLHLIPRYRQRVHAVPLQLGRPVWVDDPHFNLDYHVRPTALAAPGDDEALRRLVGRVVSQPLDRNRPLWETWVVQGLSDDRWALIAKVHHCMVDGVSGVDLLTVLLDIDKDVEIGDPQPWTPAAEPSDAALVLDAWGGLASDAVRMLGAVPDAWRHPAETARNIRDDVSGMITFSRKLVYTPPLSIEGSIGPHRRWAHAESSLDDIRTVRRAFGGTVNDVVLAACARGYRVLLEHRGDDIESAVVRTLVPVSRRTDDAHGILDNRVSAMLYELPVGTSDPVERLRQVQCEIAELKESHMADAGDVVVTAGDLAPPMIVGAVTRLVTGAIQAVSQRSVNTVTTNVPGPQFPLYCLGREMLAYYPFVPIYHGVRVGTAILSYNGTISFGVTGDFDSAPDVDVLADAIAAGVTELRDAAESELATSTP